MKPRTKLINKAMRIARTKPEEELNTIMAEMTKAEMIILIYKLRDLEAKRNDAKEWWEH